MDDLTREEQIRLILDDLSFCQNVLKDMMDSLTRLSTDLDETRTQQDDQH